MSCKAFQIAFVDHLDSGTPIPSHLAAHVATCEDCRRQSEGLGVVDALLRELPPVSPAAGFTERVHPVVADAGRAQARGRWRTRSWVPLAAAVAGLTLGLSIAWTMDRSSDSRRAGLVAENRRLRAVVEGLANTGATPGVRLAAVTALGSRPDTLDLEPLIAAMRTDPAVGVRLAAVSAVSRYASDRQVASAVAAALLEERSPHVQLALLRLISRGPDPAGAAIERFLERADLDPAVRSDAERRLNHRPRGATS